jgi:hypothetical protein
MCRKGVTICKIALQIVTPAEKAFKSVYTAVLIFTLQPAVASRNIRRLKALLYAHENQQLTKHFDWHKACT